MFKRNEPCSSSQTGFFQQFIENRNRKAHSLNKPFQLPKNDVHILRHEPNDVVKLLCIVHGSVEMFRVSRVHSGLVTSGPLQNSFAIMKKKIVCLLVGNPIL